MPARARRPGATAVEFAVVSIAFFLYLFGIIEFGQLIMVNNMLDSVAREGARYGCVNTNQGSALASNIRTEVSNRLQGLTGNFQGWDPTSASSIDIKVVTASGVTVVDASGNAIPPEQAAFGQSIQVRITANYRPMLPTFLNLPTTMTLQGTARVNCEA